MSKELLKEKLKTLKFSIGLGNFAYTPVNEELTKWIGSDNKALETTFDKLLSDYVEPWFKEELDKCIKDDNFKEILFKYSPSQKQWEEHFIKELV